MRGVGRWNRNKATLAAGQYSEVILGRGDRYQKVRWGAAILALVMAAVAFGPELAGVGAPGLGGMQSALLVVAGIAALIGSGLGRVDGRYLMLAIIFMFGCAGLFGLASLSDSDVGFMAWQLRGRILGRTPLALHQDHPRLGWVNRADVEVEDRHYDYRVRYRTDRLGARVNWEGSREREPHGAGPVDVVCLGCSFTFGQGVEDWETYAANWERLRWDLGGEQGRVVNGGVNGWGTVQVMLCLEDLLDENSPIFIERPKIVTYGFLPLHAGRNDRRRDWLEMLSASGRRKPVLRQAEGGWVWEGLVGVEGAVEVDELLRGRELATTLGCIEQMDKVCRTAGVAFYCLMLGADRMPQTPAEMTVAMTKDFCQQREIAIVDLSDLSEQPETRHPHDGHPTAGWHLRVAERLEEVLGKRERDGA